MKENNRLSNDVISEQQQLLLMALHDGECGRIARWRAQKLLARSSAAAQFIATLDALSNGIESSANMGVPRLESSLWEGVSRRIDQEERAAIYLGDRVLRRQKTTIDKRFLAPLGWSVAGGLVAASFTVFFLGNIQSSAPYQKRDGVGEFAQQGAPDPVKLVSRTGELPRIIEPRPAPLERNGHFAGSSQQPRVDVDWVHSDGSVRFFSDPSQRSTMIWVKKRNPTVRFYSAPTPRANNLYSEAPQLLEKPIPQSFAVSNR